MSTAKPSLTRSLPFRVALGVLVAGGIIYGVSRIDFNTDLHKVKVKVLSGSKEGNYHKVVDHLAARAAEKKGKIENVESAGSVDNLAKLTAAKKDCAFDFALIQDGQDWPKDGELELLGRLPRAESVFFLGRAADTMSELSALQGKKIGIGPAGSGTAKIAKELFTSRDFAGLGVTLENHPLTDQLELAANGGLDLAMFVMDEDGPLIDKAVRERGLQIAGFTRAEVLARRLPHMKAGRIAAGHYDAVKMLPATDKPVLQIDTLMVTNRCAGHSASIGVLTVLAREFPDFILHNKSTANTTGLTVAAETRGFLENEGPEIFDEWAPWLVDIMPPGKWVYLITAISILFNVMGFGHRFQLWRIDVNRVKLENEIFARFGENTTLGDIQRLDPGPEHKTPELIAAIDKVIHGLEALARKSRKQSLSILVPMGQEMVYRYQEDLMFDTLATLRAFMKRVDPSHRFTPTHGLPAVKPPS